MDERDAAIREKLSSVQEISAALNKMKEIQLQEDTIEALDSQIAAFSDDIVKKGAKMFMNLVLRIKMEACQCGDIGFPEQAEEGDLAGTGSGAAELQVDEYMDLVLTVEYRFHRLEEMLDSVADGHCSQTLSLAMHIAAVSLILSSGLVALPTFNCSQNAVFQDGSWIDPGSRKITEKSSFNGYSKWFLLNDQLRVGDMVRSRKPPYLCKPESMEVPKGTIVGLDQDSDRNGYVLVRAERKKHSPVGILHHVHRDGSVAVGFVGMETLWRGSYFELQMAETYCVGQFVRLKSTTFNPRFEWPQKRGADPAEVESVSSNTSPGMVKKYQHLENFHWAVRPLLNALGLFTAMKLGFFVGKKIGRSKIKKGMNHVAPGDDQPLGGQTAGNAAWLPPQVANIIFREGVSTPTSC
ncbi:hypothetical protein ACH5RR_039994 [Cinchona calisaya]|uniref:Uncharacterized protein n=1 Tax=Cinchona calisaya TaxID=153742 RepID=A0ABD2XZX9_9GENT